jgi:predicted short-subunit dehydrogenase-like oxidoreductase (DUF2520 family)
VYFESGEPKACGYDFTDYATTGDLDAIEDRVEDLETFKSGHTHTDIWAAIEELRAQNHHEPYDDTAVWAAINSIKECTCTPNPTN